MKNVYKKVAFFVLQPTVFCCMIKMLVFERKEIKDIISYLRVIANHDDDINLIRILNTPRRGIGRATIQMLNDEALLNGCTMWNAMGSLINRPGSPANDAVKEDLSELKIRDKLIIKN